MRRPNRLARIAIPLVMAVGITTLGMGPAFASSQVCGNGGSGYCLNDWNSGGNNNPIKMYKGGFANDDFTEYHLIGMCNNGKVSATMSCPFAAGSGLNTQFNGDWIFAIQYVNNAQYCVGTGQNTEPAILTPCPGVSGSGGGWGTIWVDGYISGQCDSSTQAYYESVHWSDATAPDASSLQSGGNLGVQAYVADIGDGAGTCWGS